MLQQELSASMERLLLSVIILVGSFAILGGTLVWDRSDLPTILPAAMVLMGNVTAYWLLSNQGRQIADQTNQTIQAASQNASPQPPVVVTPPPSGSSITQDLVEKALLEILKRQGVN